MMFNADEELLEICADVVMRYRGHDSYKSEASAIRAIKRRAPGRDQEQYGECFAMLCQVYDRAVQTTGQHHRERPNKKSMYAVPEDIDSEACLAELDEIVPGVAMAQKQAILNWVIYWHYLR